MSPELRRVTNDSVTEIVSKSIHRRIISDCRYPSSTFFYRDSGERYCIFAPHSSEGTLGSRLSAYGDRTLRDGLGILLESCLLYAFVNTTPCCVCYDSFSVTTFGLRSCTSPFPPATLVGFRNLKFSWGGFSRSYLIHNS